MSTPSGVRLRPGRGSDLPALAMLLARPGRPAPQLRLPLSAHEELLVAEQGATDGSSRLLASVRLRPIIGLELPRYSYHVGCAVHAARELKLFHRQRTLLLGNDHTGASELADIACASEGVTLSDQAAALHLVVQTALLLLARGRPHYAAQLIAELPGPCDSAAQSPFWQGLGRHFYGGDPAQAAACLGDAWRSELAALLPRQTVYASFLPAAAQAAIAQVADSARLQCEVLEAAGLHYGHHIGIDDGGPVLEAPVDTLPAVATSREWVVADADAYPDAASAGENFLVVARAEDGHEAWRAARLPGRASGARLLLGAGQRAVLGVEPGASVWAVPM